MVTRSTQQIIEMCKRVLAIYDMSCKSFWGKPGPEGIARRTEFVKLITQLENYSKEEAFYAVFEFYCNFRGFNSRLVSNLQEPLMSTLGIRLPRCQSNHPYCYANDYHECYDKFIKLAHQIKVEIGANQAGIMMVPLKKVHHQPN